MIPIIRIFLTVLLSTKANQRRVPGLEEYPLNFECKLNLAIRQVQNSLSCTGTIVLALNHLQIQQKHHFIRGSCVCEELAAVLTFKGKLYLADRQVLKDP